MSKILVACEFSGIVRREFELIGWDAWSVDLEGTEDKTNKKHITGRVQDISDLNSFDLMIAHPPCTHLCVSGARWFKNKIEEQKEALEFVKWLLNLSIKRIALENPVGVISTLVRKPDQIIQPWQFGDDTIKTTCLWLKNLPKLKTTWLVPKWMRDPDIHNELPGKNQSKNRSRTFQGIAEAMADQWGNNYFLYNQNRINPWTDKPQNYERNHKRKTRG